jgi:hypothetical protein
MMTSIGYVCVFLTALMSLSACGEARRPDPPSRSDAAPTSRTYRVRWSTALMLRALSDIDQELATPLETPIEVVGGSGRKATVRDCHSALDLLGHGFEAPRDVEQRVLRAASIRCLALRALKSATPARRSALDTFHLSDDSLDVLPPTLAPAVSDDALRRVREAEAQGKSWRDLVPTATAKLEPASDDRPDPSLVVDSDGWRVRVTPYAYGDFDGDGSEDLMLRVDEEAVGGTYRNHRLVIVTWDPSRRSFRTVREVLP